MEFFLHEKAPKPDAGIVWVHYGASLACYRRERDGEHWKTLPEVDNRSRFLGVSESLVATTEKTFADVPSVQLVGDRAAIGELRDIKAAGYPDFVGMFGLHPLFHTPLDNAGMTGPAALEPMMHAFAATLKEIVKTGLKK
jgi:hypothetical protein